MKRKTLQIQTQILNTSVRLGIMGFPSNNSAKTSHHNQQPQEEVLEVHTIELLLDQSWDACGLDGRKNPIQNRSCQKTPKQRKRIDKTEKKKIRKNGLFWPQREGRLFGFLLNFISLPSNFSTRLFQKKILRYFHHSNKLMMFLL